MSALDSPALAPLPTVAGGWRIVTADPPWPFKSNSKAKPGRNATRKPKPEDRFCAEHLPIAEVKRRLKNKTTPPVDADILAIFQCRLTDQGR